MPQGQMAAKGQDRAVNITLVQWKWHYFLNPKLKAQAGNEME